MRYTDIMEKVLSVDYSCPKSRETIRRILNQTKRMRFISDDIKVNYVRNRLADCKAYSLGISSEMSDDFAKAIEAMNKEEEK